MKIINFRLEGLTCEACVKLATSQITKIPGVQIVQIDYKTGSTVVNTTGDINIDLIKQSLEGMTFKVAN